MTGPIPDFFEGFENLREIDLSENALSGTFPQTLPLQQLPVLERFYVSGNQLTGSLPKTVNDALRELDCHGNHLTGTVPPTLATLPDLQVLLIHNNRLTGEIPQGLCDFDLNDDLFDDDLPYIVGSTRGRRQQLQSLSQRDGCTSIACPAGSRSANGVFPCTPCEVTAMNPYLGATMCKDITQEQILEVFFQSTNGGGWTDNTSWRDDKVPTCSKTGITCDKYGKILRVLLKDQSLSGTLPVELGFLSHMIELDVSHNQLEGHVPEELALAPLQALNLSDNFLTGYVPGALCRKAGVNGNGQDGILNCDTITCPMGTFHPAGRADPGVYGINCKPCDVIDGLVLGNTYCGIHEFHPSTASGGMPEWIDSFIVVMLGVAVIFAGIYEWKHAWVARMFARSRYDRTAPDQDAEKLSRTSPDVEVSIKDESDNEQEAALVRTSEIPILDGAKDEDPEIS